MNLTINFNGNINFDSRFLSNALDECLDALQKSLAITEQLLEDEEASADEEYENEYDESDATPNEIEEMTQDHSWYSPYKKVAPYLLFRAIRSLGYDMIKFGCDCCRRKTCT